MPVTPWLAKAGSFAIEHIGGIPHLNEGVDLSGPRTGVLHTTEGGWDGSLGVFRQHYAPHFLVGAGRIAQLVQVGTMGAACVSNNVHAIVQIELVAFSKSDPWLPDDPTLEALAALLAACQSEYGIPLAHPWPDGDWGRAGDNPHRHAGKWARIAGWYGHADVPSVAGHSPETHWDPGNLQWSKLLAKAQGLTEILHAPASALPVLPPHPCCAALTAPPEPAHAAAD